MPRFLTISLFLLPFIILSRFLFAQEVTPSLPQIDLSSLPSAKVIRVIDGDTCQVNLNGKPTTVRLLGVDTPETVHPSKPVQAYGKEASDFLKNLIQGESVWLKQEPLDKIDKYGRSLFYLFRVPDGLFVNLEIVRSGYGHAYTQFPFEYLETFRAYEKRARELNKGLWKTESTSMTLLEKPLEYKPISNEKPNQQIQSAPTQSQSDSSVYITKSGKKFHRAGCRSLARSMIPISRTDALQRGYGPCSICKP